MIRLLAVLTMLASQAPAREPVLGGPCEGCTAIFAGLPAQPVSSARIAPPEEAGSPLIIEGRVTTREGRPAPGIIVYAYHTDHSGIYPPAPGVTGEARRHGRLRAWVVSDELGPVNTIAMTGRKCWLEGWN